MRFLFKYPSRQRPDWFRETLAAYYSKLSGKHEYQFIIAMDNDDVSMNNVPMRQWLDNQNHLSYFYAGHKNKIHACNTDVPDDGWDILVLVSDDMLPIVEGFDDIIAQDMQRQFPVFDGALHYNDGVTGQKLLTLSIMGRELYRKIGFIYWPAYQGVWCDNDFMEICRKLGKYWYCDATIIRHEWRKHGSDAVYDKGESTYQHDRLIYEWRKARGFPVSFSQNDEDWVIRRYFTDQYQGRFLDIGAGNGVTFSNTKVLYDMGWCGLAVEPSPSLRENLRLNCAIERVRIVPAALMPIDGPVEFYHSPGDFISTTSEEHRKKWAQVQYQKIGVDGICWQTLLAQHGCDFDFINLDIEGENIPMFKLMPKEYLQRAKMLCVEYDGQAGVVNEIASPFGFRQIHATGENVILAK